MWGFIYTGVFIATFVIFAAVKLPYTPTAADYAYEWNDSVGKIYTDFSYGPGGANTFDLCVPADNTRESFGLIVCLHAGGFTAGDKRDDADTLKLLCSMGYVAAGINYTLFSGDHPDAAEMFSAMSGKAVTPDLFGKAAYDESIKDISALLWIDENSVPSVFAYGVHDKVQPFAASKRLDAALTQYNVPHAYCLWALRPRSTERQPAVRGLYGKVDRVS